MTRNTARHAKQPDAAYSAEERFEADRKVDRLHGKHIEAALAWARDLLTEDDQAFVEIKSMPPARRVG